MVNSAVILGSMDRLFTLFRQGRFRLFPRCSTSPASIFVGQMPQSAPVTGEPFNPEWGVIIREVDGDLRTIQQVMKPEIERKTGQ